jgi:hypothetical protein
MISLHLNSTLQVRQPPSSATAAGAYTQSGTSTKADTSGQAGPSLNKSANKFKPLRIKDAGPSPQVVTARTKTGRKTKRGRPASSTPSYSYFTFSGNY